MSSQFARSELLLLDRLLHRGDFGQRQGSRARYSGSGWLHLGDGGFFRDHLLGVQLVELLVAEAVEVVLPVAEELNRVLAALDCGAHVINRLGGLSVRNTSPDRDIAV